MASINYTSANINSTVASNHWNGPEEFQFSSDLFVEFGSPIFLENDENNFNSANLHHASKKISKVSTALDVKESSKPVCQRRARKGRNPWTPKEDALLVELMKKYGQSWAMISSALPGRTGKQVRDRFLNKLRPNIRCGDWSVEEDECIVTLCKEIGNRWSLIATHLPGRTEAQVKNRYYSHIKKRLDSNGTLSQTTASQTMSEGLSSNITSPQAEDLSFDFRQGYDFNMLNGTYQSLNSFTQIPNCAMTTNTTSETYSNQSTVQSPGSQTVYSSPYGTRSFESTDYSFYDAPKDLFSYPTNIEHDSQIDAMLDQVASQLMGNANKSSPDVDSYFSEDLNKGQTAESLIFDQENDSSARFDQLSKRKAYLELALAKTLKEMKGI